MISTETFTDDPGYRWQDDQTETMTPSEQYQFLVSEAVRMEQQDEWDCAYGIYRELVWRFPQDSRTWRGLEYTARQLRYEPEARAAGFQAQLLEVSE